MKGDKSFFFMPYKNSSIGPYLGRSLVKKILIASKLRTSYTLFYMKTSNFRAEAENSDFSDNLSLKTVLTITCYSISINLC